MFAFGGSGDLGEAVADGGQAQHAAALVDGGGGGRLGQCVRAVMNFPSQQGVVFVHAGQRSVIGSSARREIRSTTSACSSPPRLVGVPRCSAALRASRATTSGLIDPTDSAAVIPASTSAWSRQRCSSSTSTRARVPAASPWALRAAAQNPSWAAVNTLAARAWANAVAPGKAPGLRSRISR